MRLYKWPKSHLQCNSRMHFSHVAKKCCRIGTAMGTSLETHNIDATPSNRGEQTKKPFQMQRRKRNGRWRKEDKKKTRERTAAARNSNELQRAAHNLKWLPFYLRRILCFCAWLYVVEALVFGGFVYNNFRFFFVRCFVFFSALLDRFGRSFVTTTTTTTIFSVGHCRFVAVAVIVSFHLKWKICERQAAEAQPTEVKEHEILAKNGQNKTMGFREINKTKETRETEERWKNELGRTFFFFFPFFIFRFRK